MAIRFRKSIKIAPGLKVNISKKGTSLTVGGKGLSANINKKGVRTTTSLPGTGISHSSYQSFDNSPNKTTNPTNYLPELIGIVLIMLSICFVIWVLAKH